MIVFEILGMSVHKNQVAPVVVALDEISPPAGGETPHLRWDEPVQFSSVGLKQNSVSKICAEGRRIKVSLGILG